MISTPREVTITPKNIFTKYHKAKFYEANRKKIKLKKCACNEKQMCCFHASVSNVEPPRSSMEETPCLTRSDKAHAIRTIKSRLKERGFKLTSIGRYWLNHSGKIEFIDCHFENIEKEKFFAETYLSGQFRYVHEIA